ncbi:MAG: fructose-6-phosphate aldolase [Clostridiales bacterium]|nr:fructose-6-phosphate aldolase [Clostridiales bacterium]
MKLFIDTANLDEIGAAAKLGVIHGVTTNPTLISRERGDFAAIIREITSLVDGPVFAEVLAEDADGMVREGLELAAIHENVCVKIPMTPAGLEAISRLSKEGVKTACTLVFSAAQALLAANAGARYVAPFVGRADDIGWDGIEALSAIADVLSDGDFDTEVIAASVRSPLHVVEAARAGADIATVPPKVLAQMASHPLTDAGLERFRRDWALKRD